MVNAFWSWVDKTDGSSRREGSATLLKSVFNPHLSDRKAEGDGFTLPDTSLPYTNKLRSLVQEEDEVRQQRINHFLSISFLEDKPGALFPMSWTESMEIARPKTSKRVGALLQPRNNYAAEAEQVLKSGTPVFEKTTEDGMVFRVYRMGSLEVRTTQVYDGKESVGVIFSIRDKSDGCFAGNRRSQIGIEEIVKVTQYVETSASDGDATGSGFKYYIVLETEYGSTITTEQLGQNIIWEENVADLEDRNSLSKVVRTASCRGGGVRVQDLRRAKRPLLRLVGGELRRSQAYALSVFTYAVGGLEALMNVMESKEKEHKAQKDIDDEDEELEQKVAQVSIVEEVKLSACSKCSKAFVRGFKGAGGAWLCSPCWEAKCEEESQHRWQDGW
jgi:hypothetical protein